MGAAYQASVASRGQDARRRRQNRAQQLNAALDAIMASSLAPLGDTAAADVAAAPATDMAFVERHTCTSVWAGPAGAECVICIQDLVDGDEVRTMPCGHTFHRECMDVWLQRSRFCPLCRRPIDGQQ